MQRPDFHLPSRESRVLSALSAKVSLRGSESCLKVGLKMWDLVM